MKPVTAAINWQARASPDRDLFTAKKRPVMQDTIAPVQTTASNVHRERIPTDLMLLSAKPVPHFMSEVI